MADETVGINSNEPELRVSKIKENYGEYCMYLFTFTYQSGESTKFQVEEKVYKLMKAHFLSPKIH